MRTLLHRLRSGEDAGLSLLEVVIAMLIFAIVSLGVIQSLGSTLATTRDTRYRDVAVNLATQRIDELRAVENIFSIRDRTDTVAVNGENYTVQQRTNWVDSTGAAAACGPGGGTLRYKQVVISVLWANMRGATDDEERLERAVKVETVIDPRDRINHPDYGTILVTVKGVAGAGVAGIGVKAVPAATNPNGAATVISTISPTDSQGCSYILQVRPGNYDVSLIAQTPYIDVKQKTAPVTLSVPVLAGKSTSVPFQTDRAATFSLRYAANPQPAGARLPRALEMTYVNPTFGAFPTTSAAPASTVALHPFTDGYSAIGGKYNTEAGANSCLSPDPRLWTASTAAGTTGPGALTPAVAQEPGASGVVMVVPMAQYKVKNQSGKFIRITSQNPPAGSGNPGCTAGMTYFFDAMPNNDTTILLPYGSWRFAQSSSLNGSYSDINGSGLVGGVVGGLFPGSQTGNVITLNPPTAVAP